MQYIHYFNSREQAIGFWAIIAFSYFLYSKSIRRSMLDLLKEFFRVKLITPSEQKVIQ